MNRAFRDVVRWRSSVAHLQSSPKTISASEIRKTFLDFFCKENGHLFIRSSPVFSLKDPTLAFTNAGMNQFKGVFLGIVEPASNRVANSQKCIRIGGMHNDLSQVGENGRHHTFFEMLGNWSFGDYFKEEACRMSWDLLTKVYKIPPERLYVTYFKGDTTQGLDPDFEVKEIWEKIGVQSSHILAFGAKENFWSGSLTGPCGPCTEIHYDHSSELSDVGYLVNSGTSAVTELWNIVFTQYERKSDGTLTKLNKHFVDTGMGFERLVAVLQGKTSNYDTDLFLPLFEIIKGHTGHSGYTGDYEGNAIDSSYRVLADHSRMIAVALSDGMIPSHQSKVRGIIKRTLTIMEKTFNAKVDLLKELTVHVAESLSDTYPEIEKNIPKIHYILDEEVEIIKSKQAAAVNRWEKLKKSYPGLEDLHVRDIPQIVKGLDYISKNILNEGKTALTNEDVFILFETYGIPVDQMQTIALKLNLNFDMASYKEYERLRKEDLKKVIHQKFLNRFNEYPYFDVLTQLEAKKLQPTYDYFKYDYKVDTNGKYIFKDQPTTIAAIVYDNNLVEEINADDIQDGKEVGIIVDRTQLFSEEGGQACDSGTLVIENDIIFNIEKVVKIKNFVIHFGNFINFPRGSKVAVESLGTLKLNENRRKSIMQNHTALHLLNAALRQELHISGEKFSEVTADKLRLNVMVYRDNISQDTGVEKIEKFVKDVILHGVSVKRRIYNHSQFQSLDDVIFIPGETILEREIPVIEINSGFKLTKEYCTGTHVLNTADIQDFIITKYIKGSFYVNKIEAVTGEKCAEIRKADAELKESWDVLKNKIFNSDVPHPSEVNDLQQEIKDMLSTVSESDKISHLTKFELKNALIQAKKHLIDLIKKSVRDLLTTEITKVSTQTSDKFIVHSVNCCWNFDPEDLIGVSSACEDKPVLIFFKQKDSFILQGVVPKGFVSEDFSARKWLLGSLNTFSGTATCNKHHNPDLVYFTSKVKSSDAELNRAMNVAMEFARNAMKDELAVV